MPERVPQKFESGVIPVEQSFSTRSKQRLPHLTTPIMPLLTVNGVWRLTLTLLFISSGGFVWGMRTSLSDLENERMQNGTLIYSLLSSRQQILLFKDFMTLNAVQVIFDTVLTSLNFVTRQEYAKISLNTPQLSKVSDSDGERS